MNWVNNEINTDLNADSNYGRENLMPSNSNQPVYTVLNNISDAALTATQSDLLTSFDNIFTEAITSATTNNITTTTSAIKTKKRRRKALTEEVKLQRLADKASAKVQ